MQLPVLLVHQVTYLMLAKIFCNHEILERSTLLLFQLDDSKMALLLHFCTFSLKDDSCEIHKDLCVLVWDLSFIA